MKRGTDKIRPHQQIKIPIEFVRKMDRISDNQLHQIDLLQKKDVDFTNQYLSTQLPRKFTSLEIPQKSRQATIVAFKSIQRENSSRKASVRFRTTGAGFRQRVLPKNEQQSAQSKKNIIFRRSPSKIIKAHALSSQTKLDKIILQKTSTESKTLIKTQKKVTRDRKPQKIYFGQQYLFNEKAQYQYNQQINEQDLQWQHQSISYNNRGFGIDNDLSRFDLQSLDDLDGRLFMSKYKFMKGFCPLFVDGKYQWMEVEVKDFDQKTQSVIVYRFVSDDIRKISRLSIKFQTSPQEAKIYWRRINQAKRLRRNIKQQEKYIRYVKTRKEQFNINEVLLNPHSKFKNIIEKQWLNVYSRQCIIYKEMVLKPEKFEEMGIKIRKYIGFEQPPIVPSYQPFLASQAALKIKHYSRIDKFPQTLRKLFERLTVQACQATCTNIPLMSLEELLNLQITTVKQAVQKLKQNTRQLLLSDILGELSYSFKNKTEQIHYLKLHNFIYKDLIIDNFYYANCKNWLQFLSNFIQLNPKTPRPIIKLTIFVNLQMKRIDVNPCAQKVVNSLLQPLILIQKGTKSIPDILSEVIGGQNLIKISNSTLQNSKQLISKIVECSYKSIRSYCSNLSNKLVHLERSRLSKLPFTEDGLQKYSLMFQLIKQDWYQVTHSIIEQPPLFMVDTSPLKSTLCDSMEKQKTRLGKLIQKQIQEEIQMKIDQFQQRSQYLKQIPQDYLQVIIMRKYLNVDCQNFMVVSLAHYQLTQQFFNLLEAYCHQYAQVTFEKATQIIFIHNDFMNTIRAKFRQLNEIQQIMIQQINNERDKIIKELEQMQPQIEIIKGYASLVNFSDSYVFTSRNYFNLQKIKKDLDQINYREQLLGQQMSIFPILGKLEREIHPYFDLWNITYQLMGYINSMKTDPIYTIKYEELNQKLAEFYKELHRLINYFATCKNAQAFNICQSLIQSVKDSQSKMWIVKSFTLEGVSKKEAIRKNILDTIFKGKQVKFQELTLQHFLDQNIQQHEQFVVQNSQKADRIWKLQLRLAGIVKQLHNLQFQFQYLYKLPFVNEKLLLSLTCSIHEQIEIMDQIKDLEQAQYIQKKVNSIYSKLVVIEQTLKQISHFQIYFIPIFRLTRIEEISKEMSKQMSTLVEVERIWKNMCNHFIKQNQLWESIETDSYKNRLENLLKLMNQVNKKLDQVLDLKRQQFPRLFFISQTDFKALLLDEQKLTLSRNMTVLFSGIKTIIIQGDKIKGLIGTKQQQILFKRSLPKTIVWENLKSIVQEMDKIIAWEINFALNKKQKYAFSKTIKLLCDWTFQIQEAIGSRLLDQLLSKINSSINALCQNCSFENYYICTFLLAQRDKIHNIKMLNIYELSNFQWRKQIKYYKTEEGGTVQVKSLNLHLPFHRQFTGHQVRPILLLSDKSALQIIICAWTMNNGLFLQGKGCETIEQLSKLTLRHFINIKIDQKSNYQQITSFMKGYLLSNCWSCFSLTSILAQGIFNIIAQASFEIHSLIEAGKTLFYLGTENYNLSKSFKFNLTINNMVQKEEKPKFTQLSTYQKNYKFGIVFRSVNWLVPSESSIIKFKLEALGINPQVIKSLLQCYEIYLLKVSNQWYYKDFSFAIDNFSNQYLQIQNKDELNIIQLFASIWTPQLKPEDIQQLYQVFKNCNKKDSQQQILFQIINDVDKDINKKRQILVVGSHLSGKMSLIINIFKQANKQISNNLQYQPGSFDHWQLLDIQLYNNLIPIEQKLVVKARQTSHLSPQDVNNFIIYYHNNPIKWNNVVVQSFKISSINEGLKKQVLRQIGVLFNLPKLSQTSNSIKVALALSFLKLLIIFIKRVKMQTLNPTQMIEIVFFLIFWQAIAFFPGLYLKPNIFGSNLQRQAINYYFDTQKMAWLQWVTLQGMDFNSTATELTELHIPIKETVSVTYFMKLTANLDVWISSESLGIGTHKIIKRIIKKGILQMQKVHQGENAQRLSKIINFNAGIYKKDGKFYPKLNQMLTICIEDVNLPSNSAFDDYLSILCNHEYETLLKRKIANINFIFTAHAQSQKFKDIDLLMAKSIIRIGALNPCQQSRQTLFKYYLDWFFSNTQNPFSKQVRNTAEFLIDISIFLTNKINKNYTKTCTLAHVVKVFEGISTCSPRTIKSSLDIMQLWFFQWNSVFNDKDFNEYCSPNYNEEIQLFMKEQGFKVDVTLHQNVNNLLKLQKLVFIKHSPLKIQYSQTYRKVDILVIHQYLQNLLNQSNLQTYSFFPFIIYPQFLNMVCRIMRVLNIPKRHLLLYGEGGSGKKTLLRIASMVSWGYDALVITKGTNWKSEIINHLKEFVKHKKQLCLIFKVEEENHQLIQLAQQFIYECHPRAFLMDQNLKYLQSIGLGSPYSRQYDEFKKNIQKCVHHCMTANLKDLDLLKVTYPAIIRRLERIDVMERYMKGQLIQIAKVSVKSFYQKYSNFTEFNSILNQSNIHLSKSSFIRFMQLIVHYHSKCMTEIKLEEKMIDEAILKIRITQRQKKQLEAKLLDLKTKVHKMGVKVQQLKLQYNTLHEEHVSKDQQYKEHQEQCQIQREKTNQIRVQVQNQLNKVFPMLKAAEEAMAKVTRDDINQLRSFPNPPLPAAKVVQSLIFLFNQSQLVKEKVLEGGQKVRDFWEYAKKFILNDKLLKRVSEFKPDFIRNIDSSIITTLKNIIQKPEFIQERVFKASIAAGNLSLWVRAILAVNQVMNLMQPKKKILSEAEQALRTRQGYLKAELEQFNQFTIKLLQNKAKLDLKIEEMNSIQRQIVRIKEVIQQGTALLQFLHLKEKDWNFMKEKDLQQRRVKCRMDAIFTAVRLFILAGLQASKKIYILSKIYQLFDIKHQKDLNIIKSISLGEYQQKIYETWEQSKTNGPLFPLTENFIEAIICFHEALNCNKPMTVIVDKTDLFLQYISNFRVSAQQLTQFKIIDCLSMKNIDKVLATFTKDQNQDSQGDEVEKSNFIHKNIVVIYNLEHRPQMLANIDRLMKQLSKFQVVLIVNEQTPQWLTICAEQNIAIDTRIQIQSAMHTWFVQQLFQLQIPQIQSLSKSILQKKIKSNLLNIIQQKQNIIEHQQIMKKWTSLYLQQCQMKKQTIAHTKTFNKLQKQTFQQITNLINNKINFQTFISYIKEYMSLQSEGTATIWNLPKFVAAQLQIPHSSVVKILQPQNSSTNSLAYLFLQFEHIQQLEQPQLINKSKPIAKQTQNHQILNLRCQIVNPVSVLNILKTNAPAYICIPDKYILRKCLEQCQTIERMKIQALQQDLKQQPQQKRFNIYLLPEGGILPFKQLSQLKDDLAKQMITHKDFEPSREQYIEAYQMERLHRKYSLLPKADRQYFQRQLHHCKMYKILPPRLLYFQIQQIKNRQKSLKLVVTAIQTADIMDQNCLEFGGKPYRLLFQQKSQQLQTWQIENELFKMHYRY